jgi:hypothetical protein
MKGEYVDATAVTEVVEADLNANHPAQLGKHATAACSAAWRASISRSNSAPCHERVARSDAPRAAATRSTVPSVTPAKWSRSRRETSSRETPALAPNAACDQPRASRRVLMARAMLVSIARILVDDHLSPAYRASGLHWGG